MLEQSATSVAQHEQGGFPDNVDEDEYYSTADARLLIQ